LTLVEEEEFPSQEKLAQKTRLECNKLPDSLSIRVALHSEFINFLGKLDIGKNDYFSLLQMIWAGGSDCKITCLKWLNNLIKTQE